MKRENGEAKMPDDEKLLQNQRPKLKALKFFKNVFTINSMNFQTLWETLAPYSYVFVN
jgi:hypothetical protein